MGRQNSLPTMNDLLDGYMKRALASMFCVGIGTIQEFTSSDQTAVVSLNYKRVIKDVEPTDNNIDMKDKTVSYPLLLKCPVVFLTGGGGRLTFPVEQGDSCLIFFCDRDIDTWMQTGVTDSPPNSSRIHALSDAIALVGIRSNANPLTDFNTVIASLIDKTGERLAQAGDLKATARATASPGWLLCYGQAISRTDYDVLFAAIGTTYGVGDGSTTFNVPDFRGRGFVGLDNMGGSSAGVLTSSFTPNKDTLGGAVGEESHLLTGQESGIQQHSHTIQSRGYSDVGDETANTAREIQNPTSTIQSSVAGHTNAINKHNNIPPGRMVNMEIKY